MTKFAACAALAGAAGAASAQTIGPDAFGYTGTRIPYTFTDISLTGTNLGLNDDSYAHFAIPFSFSFYGTSYSNVSVGSNGTVYFDDTYLGLGNTAIPGNGGGYGVFRFMAVFWDDMNPGAGGQVLSQVLGAPGAQQLVVQWNNVPGFGTPDGGTFQAILSEGTNSILFNYADVDLGSSFADFGASATVGIQSDSATGLQWSWDQAIIENGMSIRWVVPAPSALAALGLGGLAATRRRR